MLKSLLAVSMLVLSVPASPARGETAELTLQQVVSTALDGNPDVLAADAAEQAADSQVSVARSAFLPRLDFEESFTRGNDPVFAFGTLLRQGRFTEENFAIDKLNHPDPLNNFQSRLGVSQVVFEGGRNWLAYSEAKLGSEVAGEQRRSAEMGIILEAVRAYFGVQVGRENLAVMRAAVLAAQADLKRAEALKEAGMATEADVLSIRVHAAGLEARRISAENDLRLLKAGLNRVMGRPLDAAFELSTPLEPRGTTETRELERLELQAVAARPEMKQMEFALERSRLARKRAQSNFLPSVAFQAGWQWDRPSFGGSGGDNWMLGVSLRWNVFSGLGRWYGLSAANAGERRSQAELESVEQAVRLDVRKAYLDLDTARQHVSVAAEAREQAKEGHRIIESRYEAGLADVTELLRSQNAYLEAEAGYLSALYQQRVAAVRVELAAGTLNPASGALMP
jgi:outer membrane protein TolC